jgi:RNA polymerase sigma-70 factor (ECF subfamily)
MAKPHYSDEELCDLLRNPLTKEIGFRALLGQYGRMLYWHIRRTVIGHDDAEDAVQETSIKIWTNLDSFKGNASQLKAWIYRIATNEALQVLRKRTTFMQSIDSIGEELNRTLIAENQLDGNKAEGLLQEALLKLPTQQRIAFNLRYYDELTYEQIAEITGKKVGNLKTNYHFAVEKIRTYLNENI